MISIPEVIKNHGTSQREPKVNQETQPLHRRMERQWFDIVGLVETHTTSSFMSPLNEYKIYHTHRVQNSRAKRKCGGISVLIRKSLSDCVE